MEMSYEKFIEKWTPYNYLVIWFCFMTFVCTNVNLIACDLLQIVYAHTHTNVLSPVFIVYAHTHTNVLSPVFQCCSDKIWFVTQHCFNKNMFKKERKKVITKTVQICRQEHQTGQEGRKNNWKLGVVWGWGKIHIHMLVCFCLLVLKYHCFYLFPNTVQHTDRQTDTHTHSSFYFPWNVAILMTMIPLIEWSKQAVLLCTCRPGDRYTVSEVCVLVSLAILWHPPNTLSPSVCWFRKQKEKRKRKVFSLKQTDPSKPPHSTWTISLPLV